jgi:hypothetical protein
MLRLMSMHPMHPRGLECITWSCPVSAVEASPNPPKASPGTAPRRLALPGRTEVPKSSWGLRVAETGWDPTVLARDTASVRSRSPYLDPVDLSGRRRPRRVPLASRDLVHGPCLTPRDDHGSREELDVSGTSLTTSSDAGVDLRDVHIAARHADPRTTMRYDRACQNLDRHPNYILAAYMSSGT